MSLPRLTSCHTFPFVFVCDKRPKTYRNYLSCCCSLSFLKMGHPRALFHLFSSFQTNITIFTTNICEKMPWPSSTRSWDSNPRPSEHESPPITTRLGHPPCSFSYCWISRNIKPTSPSPSVYLPAHLHTSTYPYLFVPETFSLHCLLYFSTLSLKHTYI